MSTSIVSLSIHFDWNATQLPHCGDVPTGSGVRRASVWAAMVRWCGLYVDAWIFFWWFWGSAAYTPGGLYSENYGTCSTQLSHLTNKVSICRQNRLRVGRFLIHGLPYMKAMVYIYATLALNNSSQSAASLAAFSRHCCKPSQVFS